MMMIQKVVLAVPKIRMMLVANRRRRRQRKKINFSLYILIHLFKTIHGKMGIRVTLLCIFCR
jgi:hypothetical protein